MCECKWLFLWLNLEYLSVEEWIGSCYVLLLLQVCGFFKYFFFFGFCEFSGGLLCEVGLLECWCCFQVFVLEQDEFFVFFGVWWKVGE